MKTDKLLKCELDEIKLIHESIEKEIEERINDFKDIWNNGSEEQMFYELVFCLLTPQSKARTCWLAVLRLKEQKAIFYNDKYKIAEIIHPVRFKYNKAGYIIEARDQFYQNNDFSIKSGILQMKDNFLRREWLVGNIKGMGFKEASHFLRNIGFGDDIMILDRHIIKNLYYLGVIDSIPKTISKKNYYEIENKMVRFSDKIGISIDHLDFVLWFKETKDIFK